MTSAELARVREVESEDPSARVFMVGSDNDEREEILTYWWIPQMAFCDRHRKWNDCTCWARVQLCGILTGSVTQIAKVYPSTKQAAPLGAEV